MPTLFTGLLRLLRLYGLRQNLSPMLFLLSHLLVEGPPCSYAVLYITVSVFSQETENR